jgi:hypothetical protein
MEMVRLNGKEMRAKLSAVLKKSQAERAKSKKKQKINGRVPYARSFKRSR